jgi:hypothetical protein
VRKWDVDMAGGPFGVAQGRLFDSAEPSLRDGPATLRMTEEMTNLRGFAMSSCECCPEAVLALRRCSGLRRAQDGLFRWSG